jgi:hypothetical protein
MELGLFSSSFLLSYQVAREKTEQAVPSLPSASVSHYKSDDTLFGYVFAIQFVFALGLNIFEVLRFKTL